MTPYAMLAGLILQTSGTGKVLVNLFLSAFCVLISKSLTILAPFSLKVALDNLSSQGSELAVCVAVMGYVAARFGGELFQEFKNYLFTPLMSSTARALVETLHDHVFLLPLRFHWERKAGRLARIFDRGIDAVTVILSQVVFNIVPKLVEFILTVVILAVFYDWVIVSILGCTVLIYFLATFLITKTRIKIKHSLDTARGELSATITEHLHNFEIIRIFRKRADRRGLILNHLDSVQALSSRWERNLVHVNTLQVGIIFIGLSAVLLLVTTRVFHGVYTVGDLIFINSLFLQIAAQLSNAASTFRNVFDAVTDISACQELLKQPTAATRSLDNTKLADVEVELSEVTYSFRPGARVIDRVSLKVPEGSRMAIVGPTGAGKSTLIRLLTGSIAPDCGTITIGGRDLSSIAPDVIPDTIAVVPQDVTLFHDSLANNVRFGRQEAGEQEVWNAICLARLADVVDRMPQKQATIVGERGLLLSGGERQRVAIARALLTGAKVIILDEATSALDSGTEESIKQEISNLSGLTFIVVAHRLSTIIDFDQIIVLDAGRVAEQGDHNSLMALKGLYYQMWTRQVSED